MKKKLFAVAMVVFVYVLCIMLFSTVDKQDKVNQFFSKIGLSSTPAIASPSATQDGSSDSNITSTPSLRNPCPPPLKKPAPRRKKKGGN